MPHRAWNKSSPAAKRRFFELVRAGWSGQAASLEVGVSPSAGSLWFIDAGGVRFVDTPISNRYLSQDDRIEIADGLAVEEPVKQIAARIGKSYQTVYREIARNRKADGRYQPYYAHGQAYRRRRRPRAHRVSTDQALRSMIAAKLDLHWSPGQISRWLRRRWHGDRSGTCAPKRSIRRSTWAWWPARTRRRWAPGGPTGTSTVGAAPATGR